ncbi:MAG: hypothetical protein OEM52_08375 [bacterium]|nr:hypothetical protein [bacterium]
MADYNLSAMDPRSFEHIVQALAKKVIGEGVTPFGDGPDGGREATFTGPMDYPSKTKGKWDGYLVIQCKYRQRPESDDTAWAIKQLKEELEKYTKKDSKRRIGPDYFLFVTNVVLPPKAKTGGHDKIMAVLAGYQKKLKLKGYDVWGYDDLSRFLDGAEGVRNAYTHLITPGDVLAAMKKQLKDAQPDFTKILQNYLQKELLDDRYTKMGYQEVDSSLAKLFFDLPVNTEREVVDDLEEKKKEYYAVKQIVKHGSIDVRMIEISPVVYGNWPGGSSFFGGNPFTGMGYAGSNASFLAAPDSKTRVVIVGGPGQGKSTLTQFLCQAYRATILEKTRCISEAKKVIGETLTRCHEYQLNLSYQRFPLRIILNKFAEFLAKPETPDVQKSVMGYLCRAINQRTSSECRFGDLKLWLEKYPWLIVFDGLDEVPHTSNRQDVVKAISDFQIDVTSCNGDVLTVITTRPQSYQNEFSSLDTVHWNLQPLNQKQALAFADNLLASKYPDKEAPKRKEAMARLKTASKHDVTMKLMESPLQVSLMTSIAESHRPPERRYELFERYYSFVYDRECGKESLVSPILRNNKAFINRIHHEIALLLHCRAEESGNTSSQMQVEEFLTYVEKQLRKDEHKEDEVTHLMALVKSAVIDRLVFLVQKEEGSVQFEVRSLQEFFAWRALEETDDKTLHERLNAIAPVSHWHNVFMYAVGAIFMSGKDYRKDWITALCLHLNDCKTNVLFGKAYTGSELALDILQEGVVTTTPKYRRAFLPFALKLMDLNDQVKLITLAKHYSTNDHDLFFPAIEQQLHKSRLIHQKGAYSLLAALADQGEQWAIDYIGSHWPEAEDIAIHILYWRLYDNNRRQKTNDWLDKIRPEKVGNYPLRKVFDTNLINEYLSKHKLPQLSFPFHETKRVKDNVFSWIEWSLESSSLLKINHPKEWSVLPVVHPEWRIFQAIGRFANEPSAKTLAKELRWLSELPETVFVRYPIRDSIPWPMSACLTKLNRERLKFLAESLESGKMGDINDWNTAESRWFERGVTKEDYAYHTIDGLPYDARIAEIGFPINGITLWIMHSATLAKQRLNFEINEIADQATKYRLFMTIIQLSDDIGFQPFELVQFQSMLTTLRIKVLATDLIYFIGAYYSLPALATELLFLGEQMYCNTEFDVVYEEEHWGRNSPGEDDINYLVREYTNNPQSNRYLLPLLGNLLAEDNSVAISPALLELSNFPDPVLKYWAMFLRIAQPEWNGSDIPEMVEAIQQETIERRINFLELLNRTTHYNPTSEPLRKLALALWDAFEPMPEDHSRELEILTRTFKKCAATVSCDREKLNLPFAVH